MLSISTWCGFHVPPFCCRGGVYGVWSSLNSLWHCAQRQVARNERGSLAREMSFRRSYRLGYFRSQFYFVPAEGACFWGLMPMLQSQDKLQCCTWKRIPELQNQGSWWKEECFYKLMERRMLFFFCWKTSFLSKPAWNAVLQTVQCAVTIEDSKETTTCAFNALLCSDSSKGQTQPVFMAQLQGV